MELQQKRSTGKTNGQKTPGKTDAAQSSQRFIDSGEAVLLAATTGLTELIQWALDLVPYVGWIINGGITFVVGFGLFIWVSGKVAKGAPKKWYKAIYWGAVGGALPVIPGYLGSIIYLLIQDRKILGKIAGKMGEEAEEKLKKLR